MSDFMMDYITKKELKAFIGGLSFKKIQHDKQDIADDGASMLLDSFLSIGARFGATDYNDHRQDTPGKLKTLIWGNLNEPRQRINYYKDDKTPYKTIGLVGSLGGYTAYFIE